MKSILETSIYLIIMALICMISIGYIAANRQISDVNSMAQYIKEYIEINGKWESTDSDSYRLKKETINDINKMMPENMEFEYEYKTKTEGYIYWNACIYYKLAIPGLSVSGKHPYKLLIRAVYE